MYIHNNIIHDFYLITYNFLIEFTYIKKIIK